MARAATELKNYFLIRNIIMATLIILRGIPGSGKSTYAASYKQTHPGTWVIVSADSFFIVNGKYNFDPKMLQAAHDCCYNSAVRAISEGKNVILDNTNRRIDEFSRYMHIPGIETIEIHRLMADFGSTKAIPPRIMEMHRTEYEPHPLDRKKVPVK